MSRNLFSDGEVGAWETLNIKKVKIDKYMKLKVVLEPQEEGGYIPYMYHLSQGAYPKVRHTKRH